MLENSSSDYEKTLEFVDKKRIQKQIVMRNRVPFKPITDEHEIIKNFSKEPPEIGKGWIHCDDEQAEEYTIKMSRSGEWTGWMKMPDDPSGNLPRMYRRRINMKEKLKEMREKSIKLAVAYLKFGGEDHLDWTEDEVRAVSIGNNSDFYVGFHRSGSWGGDPWRDSVTITIEEIEDDFDSVIEKWYNAHQKIQQEKEKMREEEDLQDKLLKEQKELEEYNRLKNKFERND